MSIPEFSGNKSEFKEKKPEFKDKKPEFRKKKTWINVKVSKYTDIGDQSSEMMWPLKKCIWMK